VRDRARGRRMFAALADVLVDEHGALPCDPPDGCPACCLFAAPLPNESNVEHGRRLVAAMLCAENRRTMREVMHG